MAVSQSLTRPSIDLSDLPVEVADAVARVVEFCREQAGSAPSAETFKTVETGLRDAMNGLGCKLLGAYAESRDDGASRIERDGHSWFRVAATPKTIMTTLGPVTYRRARYRSGASSTSLVPVDESLGLIDDYLTRPAAQLGLMMMGHCTPREVEEFFAKMGGMTPSSQAAPAPAPRSRLSSSMDITSISRTARRSTSGGNGSRSRARWITKRDRSMPLAAAARPLRSHSASVAMTTRWRRPAASSLIAGSRPKGPATSETRGSVTY